MHPDATADIQTARSPGSPWPHGVTRLDRFAGPAVVLTLWLSWPILQVVGDGPIFFLARGAHRLDVFAVGIAIALVLPLAAGTGSAFLPSVAGRLVFMVANVAASLGLIGQTMSALGADSVVLWAAPSLALAIAVHLLFDRSTVFRLFIRYLAVAPIAVLVVFLAGTPASAIAFAEDPQPPPSVAAAQPVPLVLVVFDELPTASLITPAGEINATWYPTFARLQADATWFRNAATVHQQTDQAVPAILTGTVPAIEDLPIRRDHPQTVFSLLGPEYSILSHETVTHLCPPTRCSGAVPEQTAGERWSALVGDLGFISAHTFLPDELTNRLPRIDQQWANFGKVAQLDAARTPKAEVEAFIEAVRTYDESLPFFFLHAMLPHRPWVYLPDGRYYGGETASSSVGMGISNGWQTDQSRQRHVLQTQFADHLLSQLIAALEEEGLYDRALVIVTADHGVSFLDSGADRIVSARAIEEIGSVPLFIKYPGGSGGGEIDDFRALTVDVLPTIADVLGMPLPATVDGVSLHSGERPRRDSSITLGPLGAVEWPADGLGKYAAARRLADLFPEADPFVLSLDGVADLVGTKTSELQAFERDTGWQVLDPESFTGLGDASVGATALVQGRTERALPDRIIAVAVDGVVRGLTRSYEWVGGGTAFDVIIDPRHFETGSNDIEIFGRPLSQ